MHTYTVKSTNQPYSIILSLNTDFTHFDNYAYSLKDFRNHNICFKKSIFKWGIIEYKLKKPIICSKKFEDGLWIIECDKYNLHVFNESEMEAELQLNEQFIILCDGLLNERDDKLTKDAIKLRNKIKEDIKSY